MVSERRKRVMCDAGGQRGDEALGGGRGERLVRIPQATISHLFKVDLCSQAESLSLESNPGSSLQTEEEAGLP